MDQGLNSPLDEAFESTHDPSALPPGFEELDIPLEETTNQLLHVGYLTKVVTFGKHQLIIRTLRIGEEFEAALLAKKYEDTVEAGRALATALIAASIMTMDGHALITEPIGPGDYTLEAQFLYVLQNFYWPPIKLLYEEYRGLVSKMTEAYENLLKV